MAPLMKTATAFLCALAFTTAHAIDFTVPDEAQRLKAIGDLSGCSPLQARAFTPDARLFQPIPKPKANDWLASHEEAQQTFDQFRAEPAAQPDALHKKLYLLPLGEFPPGSPSLSRLTDFAQAFFGMPVAITGSTAITGLPIATRRNAGTQKRQLLTTDILTWLQKQKPKDAFSIIAVTMEDLYPEESWNFVFGEASLAGGTGVFSFARYDPQFFGERRGEGTEKLILERSLKVLAHEMSHMFGIEHCTYFHCLMNGANHMRETDESPLHLCPMCLRKLHHGAGFNLMVREQALMKFYQANGLPEEAEWEGRRVGQLSGKTP